MRQNLEATLTPRQEERLRAAIHNEAGYLDLVRTLYPVIYHRTFGRNMHGDAVMLLDTPDEIGLLAFGYGSCPGCDALQDCDTPDKVVELMTDFVRSVRWFGSMSDLIAFVEHPDASLVEVFTDVQFVQIAGDLRAAKLGDRDAINEAALESKLHFDLGRQFDELKTNASKLMLFRSNARGLLQYAAMVFEQVKPIHAQIAENPDAFGEEAAKLSGMFVNWHAHYMDACAKLLKE